MTLQSYICFECNWYGPEAPNEIYRFSGWSFRIGFHSKVQNCEASHLDVIASVLHTTKTDRQVSTRAIVYRIEIANYGFAAVPKLFDIWRAPL